MLVTTDRLWLIDLAFLMVVRLALAKDDENDIDLSQCDVSQTCYRDPANCTSLTDCNFAAVILPVPARGRLPIKFHSKSPLPKPYVSLRFVSHDPEGNLTYVYCSPLHRTIQWGILKSGLIFVDSKTSEKLAVLERVEHSNGIVRCDFSMFGQPKHQLITNPKVKNPEVEMDFSGNYDFYGFVSVNVTDFAPPTLSQFRIVIESDAGKFTGDKILKLTTKEPAMAKEEPQSPVVDTKFSSRGAKSRQQSDVPKENVERLQLVKKKEEQPKLGSLRLEKKKEEQLRLGIGPPSQTNKEGQLKVGLSTPIVQETAKKSAAACAFSALTIVGLLAGQLFF